ncbi:MAG: hypothetical protein AAB446_01840 [Patescibacteria group bacterium]
MKCKFCGNENMSVMALVPARSPDGALTAFACLPCAKKKGLYCEKHDRPFTGFDDETSVCIMCVEEFIKQEKYRIHEVAKRIFDVIPYEEKERLLFAAEIAAELTDRNRDVAIFRFVASRAKRSGLLIDDIIDEHIAKTKSVSFILGEHFHCFP